MVARSGGSFCGGRKASLFEARPSEQPSETRVLLFYGWLQQHHPELVPTERGRTHHAWNVVDGYIVDLTIKLAHKQARKHFKQMGMSTKPPRDRYEGREYAGLELAEKFAELFHMGVKIKS